MSNGQVFALILSIVDWGRGNFLKVSYILNKIVACRVQNGKKAFCHNSYNFGYSFIKNDIMLMYILCIYKKPIVLSLFKIDTLNFTMYVLTILKSPLKINVIGLHKPISMNIFFNIKFLLYNSKKTA